MSRSAEAPSGPRLPLPASSGLSSTVCGWTRPTSAHHAPEDIHHAPLSLITVVPVQGKAAGHQGDRLRGSGIPARALLCFMSRLATSEVGHGERGDKAAPDRTLLGPQGPAPNLEGRLPAPGDHAPRALRNAGGRGGLR